MVTSKNLVDNEANYPWEYIPGQEGREDAIRWKTLLGGKNSKRKDITFGVLDIPPGHTLDPHHHDPAEAYYVLEGKGRLLIDDRFQEIGPGAVVYIVGNEVHGIRNHTESTLKLVWIFPTDSYHEIQYNMDEDVNI